MTEIKLVKKYPNIRDEDVTEIFQEGYLKGFENGRKNAIPVEWIENKLKCCDNVNAEIFVKSLISDWEKENEERTKT